MFLCTHYSNIHAVSDHSISPSQSDVRVCPSCSTSTALVSVISATATALLATVIFVLVLIAVRKYHPKFTSGGTKTGTSAGGEGQEYEEVDEGKGGRRCTPLPKSATELYAHLTHRAAVESPNSSYIFTHAVLCKLVAKHLEGWKLEVNIPLSCNPHLS